MKRIATIAAVITAFAVAPSLAAAGNVVAQVTPQVSTQVVGTEVARTQVARSQHVQTAVSLQRHVVQLRLARHLGTLRAQIR